MRYLLDTGILARLPHRSDPLHQLVREAVQLLISEGHTLVTGTRNVAEFWALCTRPSQARGGFGLGIDVVQHRLRILERLVNVLRETNSYYPKWKEMVSKHRVNGKQVHDARIAALMSAHRVRRVLTLNAADFTRYPTIEVVTPVDVLTV